MRSKEYETYAPLVRKTFEQMADMFDNDPNLLLLNAVELSKQVGLPHEAWRDFLALPAVDQYARAISKSNAQVAFRKALNSLTTEASQGNVQAAKQITEISEILQQEATRRTIVLTYVPRQTLPPTRNEVAQALRDVPIEEVDTDETDSQS